MNNNKENKNQKISQNQEEIMANKQEFYNNLKRQEQKIHNTTIKVEKLDDKVTEIEGKIDNRVNWGIRTISYTSLVISLGLAMVLSVIALTFKINLATKTVISVGELIGIIVAIFACLTISFCFLIWWIKKKILC